LEERRNAKIQKECRGEKGGIHDHVFRGGHGGPQVKIRNVSSAEMGIFGHRGVEGGFECRDRGGVGGHRAVNMASVATTCATNPPHYFPVSPFFFGNRVIARWLLGTGHDRLDGPGILDQFCQLHPSSLEPMMAVGIGRMEA
jgi:hypothetical protein